MSGGNDDDKAKTAGEGTREDGSNDGRTNGSNLPADAQDDVSGLSFSPTVLESTPSSNEILAIVRDQYSSAGAINGRRRNASNDAYMEAVAEGESEGPLPYSDHQQNQKIEGHLLSQAEDKVENVKELSNNVPSSNQQQSKDVELRSNQILALVSAPSTSNVSTHSMSRTVVPSRSNNNMNRNTNMNMKNRETEKEIIQSDSDSRRNLGPEQETTLSRNDSENGPQAFHHHERTRENSGLNQRLDAPTPSVVNTDMAPESQQHEHPFGSVETDEFALTNAERQWISQDPQAPQLHQIDDESTFQTTTTDAAIVIASDRASNRPPEIGLQPSMSVQAGTPTTMSRDTSSVAISAVLAPEHTFDEMRANARREGEEQARRELAAAEGKIASVAIVREDSKRRPWVLMLLAVLLLTTVGVTVGLVLLLQPSPSTPQLPPSETASPTALPAPQTSNAPSGNVPSSVPSISIQPSSAPTGLGRIQRNNLIRRVVMNTSSEEHFFAEGDNPHKRALDWMLFDDLLIQSNTADSIVRSRYVVVLMYMSMGGETWTPVSDFLEPSARTCTWGYYIDEFVGFRRFTCTSDESIEDLSFNQMNLSNQIITEISALQYLRQLNLGSNRLTGTIPTHLGLLSNLFALRLGDNNLHGPIPSVIGNMPELTAFYVHNNVDLSGTVPTEVAVLPRLRQIQMQYTNVTNIELFCNRTDTISLFLSDCLDDDVLCTCCTSCCAADPSLNLCFDRFAR